jgi:very-short-patch-repair endonuclease
MQPQRQASNVGCNYTIMQQKPNFDNIKFLYEKDYLKALERNVYKVLTNAEDWYAILNTVQLNLYNDIKLVGLLLYPYYPIGEYFIDFGNPFAKVGIEILYKNGGLENKQDRLNFFKENGWTVYTIDSKNTYETAFELFDRTKQNTETLDLDQIELNDWWDFIKKNKDTNGQCLIYFIKQFHKKEFFPESYLNEDFDEDGLEE